MAGMDVVVATFRAADDAVAAASHLASALSLDEDLVAVEPVGLRPSVALPQAVKEDEAEAVLVAWVQGEDRGVARDLISRHRGRHVPLDWLNARQEEVASETFPVPPRPLLWQGS
jgi:hypothetical protein